MEDIFVAQLMSTGIKTVSPDTLVEEAAQLMLEHRIGSVIVTNDNNELAGILTTTDFVKIVAEQKPKDQTPVSAYMTTDVITTTAQRPISDVADEMIEHGFHHMPVVDGDDVLGMITTTDLAKYLSNMRPQSA
ncbi:MULTISPECIES: CBS domain-containing protein [unclassified Haladaptatus]|uniref:CBS domain-containing protein n=1 Tax=unclassified Haladaptatus TaxID=2622732 RepID=UPI002FCE4FA0